MPTFDEFSNTPTVDLCVKKEREKEIANFCSTCDINNCTRSWGYKSSMEFWKNYVEQQEITNFLQRVNRYRDIPAIRMKEGFRYVK
jgi:hypothetical protein